jgi:DNA-binding winged helix-turn-helix (wHTH) protein/TolB-like protein/Flp pilus assembly protein TadD
MGQQDRRLYQFDSFRLDAEKRRLFKDGEALTLASKALELLIVLVENPGRVVEKDELMQTIWADSFVEEANLTVNMSALRKALGDSKNLPRYILTVSGRGYRFLADVQQVEEKDENANADNLAQQAIQANLQPQPEFPAEVAWTIDNDSRTGAAGQALSRIPVAEYPQPSVKNWTVGLSRPRALRVIFAIAFASGLLFLVYRLLLTPGPNASIKSVAILPFQSLNPDASHTGLELGMTETLITKLSSLGRIVVSPTGKVRKYGNSAPDPLAAGSELGVDAVLEGNIQRDGERLRITVNLRKVESGLSLWQQTYDRNFKDIFEVQDTISEEVVKALTLTLSGAEQKQLVKHPTNNTEAYQAYLQGRYFWNKRSQEGYKKAIGYFGEALEKDPNFALAYSGLADCHLFGAEQLPPKETMEKAKDAALKALQIDDTLAEVHTSLAKIKQFYDWDWAGAEESFQRAIALNPNYETAHHWYAQYLMDVGRAEEAFREIYRARELSPHSLIINTDVGSLHQDVRQYDQAINIYRKVIEMDANFARAHLELGRALERQGLYEDALKELGIAVALSGETPRMLASMGYIYAVSGNQVKALQTLEKLNRRARQGYVSPYHPAMIYAGLGNKEKALELLEQAYQERFGLLVYLKIEPRFDGLREEPQFKDLLRRIGLPQ